MINGALVLEGGSLRCLFTAGVLDVLLKEEIEFSYVNGVSAGTMAGMNYISKQSGRMLKVNETYLHDKRYMSLRSLVKNRLVFNFDFLFGELSDTLLPFDHETFYRSEQKFEVVATRCKTGRPEFFAKDHCSEIIQAVRASSSMPLLSKMVTVNHKKYLDGGISLPIAYQRPIDLGYEKVVLILTRHRGYRKKPLSHLKEKAYERYFAPLPKLVPERYNRMQEEIDQLEKAGKIFIIRPEKPVEVSRLEQDVRKLQALHGEGVRVAEEKLKDLKEYLEI